jgi:hypothetical protein
MDRISGVYKRYLKWISLGIGLALAIFINADTLRVGKALWNDPNARSEIGTLAEQYLSKCGESCVPPGGESVNLAKIQTHLAAAKSQLRPLPLGWTEARGEGWWWVWKAAGLILTGLALSLGAPFWFDALSTFVNVRGTGPKPQREDAK